jgi:hypothetical protein
VAFRSGSVTIYALNLDQAAEPVIRRAVRR